MGKGDKKTRRGKINIGTFGRLRRRKKSNTAVTSTKPKAKTATKAKAAPKQKPAEKAKPAAKKTTKKKAEEEEE